MLLIQRAGNVGALPRNLATGIAVDAVAGVADGFAISIANLEFSWSPVCAKSYLLCELSRLKRIILKGLIVTAQGPLLPVLGLTDSTWQAPSILPL